MGNSPSSQAANPPAAEQAKLEALFQTNGSLVLLRTAFDVLSKKNISGGGDKATVLHADLKVLFELPLPVSSSNSIKAAVKTFNALIVAEVLSDKAEVTYPAFLSGLARTGKLGSKKEQIELLFRCFMGIAPGEGIPELGERVSSNGEASTSSPSEDAPVHSREKKVTVISRGELEGILLALWYLTAYNSKSCIFQENGKPSPTESRDKNPSDVQWPDLSPLTESAFGFDEAASKETNKEVSSKQDLPFEQLVRWAVATLPGLSDVLEPFLVRQCCRFLDQKGESQEGTQGGNSAEAATSHGEEKTEPEKSDGGSELQYNTTEDADTPWKPGMLTPGVAWSLGLATSFGTAKWGVGPRLTDLGCGGGDLTRLVGRPRLLYRSSEHGRGMNRLMSHVEGYSGTVLVVIAARSLSSGDSWAIGALLPDGLDNKRGFFGSPNSCLFSLKPAFKVFRASGRESNFVYCHARVAGQGYQSHPLPEGFGLGGTLGKERVWLDDNATPGKVTVRHHAVDKTFQPGALVPELGYGGVDARVEDVEVWGLGGQQADSKQRAFLEREQRFQEQRRKVDMKKFAEGWQESPDRLILEWGGART